MLISLDDIKTFSECPKYYEFIKGSKKKNENSNINIAIKVIKKAYNVARDSGFKADWRRIINWINSETFSSITTIEDPDFNKIKQQTEYIISFLNNWYYKIYLPENKIGYCDLEIEKIYDTNTVYTDIPIVKIENFPTILYISSVAPTQKQMYNNIKYRGTALFLANALQSDKVEIQHLTMNVKGGYTFQSTNIDLEDNNRVNNHIGYIAKAISNGVNYSSITEKCKECPFRMRCIL